VSPLIAMFSNNFFDDVVKMDDKGHDNELAARKAGTKQCLLSFISNEYNESANNKFYGVFTVVESEQIGKFGKGFNVMMYLQLSWIKAITWFKAIVTRYQVALNWFTKPDKRQPNFYMFCQKKPQMCYYPLYCKSNLKRHKAFSVVLADYILDDLTVAGKSSGKQGGVHGCWRNF
jgi:hypothetical protein